MHQKITYWDKSTRLIKPLNIPKLAKWAQGMVYWIGIHIGAIWKIQLNDVWWESSEMEWDEMRWDEWRERTFTDGEMEWDEMRWDEWCERTFTDREMEWDEMRWDEWCERTFTDGVVVEVWFTFVARQTVKRRSTLTLTALLITRHAVRAVHVTVACWDTHTCTSP